VNSRSVFIEFPDEVNWDSIFMCDQLGQRVYCVSSLANQNRLVEIDFSNFDKGVYTIIINSEHLEKAVKLVK
jgi:hypothetical protein